MIIKHGPPPKTRSGTVACDLEIFGLSQRQLHRPRGKLAVGGFSLDGETVYLVEQQKDLERAIANLIGCRWVFHNSNFDIRHLRGWVDFPILPMNQYRDTFVLEKLLWSGYYNAFGLDDLARRYLGIILTKGQRESFYEEHQLTQADYVYAANDVAATWKIHEAQESFLEKYPKALKVWEEIDGPAQWAILDLKGFPFDVKKWRELAKANTERAEQLKSELGFNPGSPPQTKAAFAKVGIRIPSTGDEILKNIKHPLAEKVLEYRGAAKRASAYGEKFIEFVEEDGMIWPSFNVYGAETGRMSSDGPNMQQVPSSSDYRSCFVAESGKRLVIADYSAQEIWISAEFSRDPVMLAALRSGGVYEYVAREMYHDPSITDKHHPLRKKAKAVALGRLYGLTPYGLEAQRGIPKEEGEDLFERFDTRFAGTTSWIRNTHVKAKDTEYVETLGGRRFYLNTYFNLWKNNAVNAPIQGSGADMMKIALASLYKYYEKHLGRDFPIIAPIHDELVSQFTAGSVRQEAKIIKQHMQMAFDKLCPNTGAKSTVDVHVGKTWADKE